MGDCMAEACIFDGLAINFYRDSNNLYDSRPGRGFKVDALSIGPVWCSGEVTAFATSDAWGLTMGTGIAPCLHTTVNAWQSGMQHRSSRQTLSGPDRLAIVN